ncbi:MAG: pentapeptide repeat-containing protein [Cyanobacteria bacterium P01_F01_bin.13]
MSRDALIVGINSYQYLQTLKAPATDAEAIAQRLAQDGEFKVWRVPEKIDPTNGNRPVVSATQVVSQLQLEKSLKQLFRPGSSQAPETALFYFSGHGIPDEDGFDQGYLAASDTNPRNLRSGLSLRWLQWLLSESQVKQQIIWLDCCHSGSLIVNVGAANPGNSASRDRCFIASSREFESSWEDLNSEYSVLTKALLEGLEPSRLPGRWIDTFALVDYVNQALKGELQTPVCTNFGEAINLTRTWQEVSESAKDGLVDSGICPYKGLEFFDCNGEDPKYFFGREKLIGQLLDQVRTSNFMALVGASGNGKSSVLRAGLIHQLQMGRRIANSDQWQILITRPDVHPIENLAAAFVPEGRSQVERAKSLDSAAELLKRGSIGLHRLVQASEAARIILVIDQFEEVFTRCESAEEREKFFSCLMGALEKTGDKLRLIIAMRADFVGKCLEQEYSGLAEQVQQHMISVLPLTTNELRDAICQPAEQASLKVEPALVTEILNDIQGAPGSLPLLQYTLKELWQLRQENTLMLSAYQDLGGINGTLDKRATEIYNSFDGDQQWTVQHIFQQLTQLGEGTEDTRRRVFLDNLVSEPLHPVERVRDVIDRLSDKENRLLITNEVVGKGKIKERRAIVDVAHEALIRHWRLLRQWIEKNRDSLRQQRRIEANAVTWQEHKQSRGYLLQGIPLIESIQFQKDQAEVFPLSDSARNFIKKSLWQRHWSRLKLFSLLIIPAIVIDFSLHSWKIQNYYNKLNGANKADERESVLRLTEDCDTYKRNTGYLRERFTGQYCRSLAGEQFSKTANLSDINLHFTDLRSANLRSANLRSALLRYADLSKAFLSYADFRSADLSYSDISEAFLGSADLSEADLREANLSGTILLATNLYDTKELTQKQLEGENSPYICNSLLPEEIEIKGGKDRDCDKLADILHQRYPGWLENFEAAAALVKAQQAKTWE